MQLKFKQKQIIVYIIHSWPPDERGVSCSSHQKSFDAYSHYTNSTITISEEYVVTQFQPAMYSFFNQSVWKYMLLILNGVCIWMSWIYSRSFMLDYTQTVLVLVGSWPMIEAYASPRRYTFIMVLSRRTPRPVYCYLRSRETSFSPWKKTLHI